jgi:hypothetical protein
MLPIKNQDGHEINKPNFLNITPSSKILNEVFQSNNLIDARLDIATRICYRFRQEVEHLNNLIKATALDRSGWVINFNFCALDTFYAEAGQSLFAPQNTYELRVSLGVPVITLSVVLELMEILESTRTRIDEPENLIKPNSITVIFNNLTKEESVSDLAIELALDTCLLLYFHELSHILFGHCDYQTSDENELRAIELDADFNAGSFFCSLVSKLPDPLRRPSSTNSITERLIRASFILGTILKACSTKSKKYHYPTVRVNCFVGGGAYYIRHSALNPNVTTDSQEDQYWEEQTNRIQPPLLEALRKSSLAYYAGTEIEIDKDRDEMDTITYTTRNRLKDGPLKHLKIPIR